MPLEWGEILRFYQTPPNVAAYLDWSSGVMRVNASFKEWIRMESRHEEWTTFSTEEMKLVETATHEVTHFLQIITTGYLYRFAVNLYWEIGSWIGEAAEMLQGSTSDQVLNLLTTAIPVSVAERARAIATTLNTPGPEGLTVRAIVESAALLVQKRTYCHDYNDKTYGKMLDNTLLPSDYRSAYDVASKYLGDDTLDTFPYLASLSLCTDNPPKGFVNLCQGVARLGLAREGAIRVGAIARLLEQAGCRIIGTAAEVATSLPEHPVYSAAVNRINVLHSEGVFSLDEYMVVPHLISVRLVNEVARPMLFNKRSGGLAVVIPPQIWPNIPDEERDAKMKGLIVIAAIYARVFADSSA